MIFKTLQNTPVEELRAKWNYFYKNCDSVRTRIESE
jgi:hypothetical protein